MSSPPLNNPGSWPHLPPLGPRAVKGSDPGEALPSRTAVMASPPTITEPPPAERERRDHRSLRLDQLATEGRSKNNFDVLRLIAALLVLFGHSFDLLNRPQPGGYLGWGFVGVTIFFAISGFLVARSWDLQPEARRRSPPSAPCGCCRG